MHISQNVKQNPGGVLVFKLESERSAWSVVRTMGGIRGRQGTAVDWSGMERLREGVKG